MAFFSNSTSKTPLKALSTSTVTQSLLLPVPRQPPPPFSNVVTATLVDKLRAHNSAAQKQSSALSTSATATTATAMTTASIVTASATSAYVQAEEGELVMYASANSTAIDMNSTKSTSAPSGTNSAPVPGLTTQTQSLLDKAMTAPTHQQLPKSKNVTKRVSLFRKVAFP